MSGSPSLEVVDDGETYREYSGLTWGWCESWPRPRTAASSCWTRRRAERGETRIQDSLRPVEAWEYLLCRDEKVLA